MRNIKKDDVKLEWNVFVHDINKRQMKIFNVFTHGRYKQEIIKLLNHRDDYTLEEFKEKVKSSTMYYYWCKCEWEILIAPWVGDFDKESVKMDVYKQLEMNWDHYIKYLWEI